MELTIKDKTITLEPGNIYGLVMDEPLNQSTNTLTNKDYYELIKLDNPDVIKLAYLIGVNDTTGFTNNKRKHLAKLLSNKSDYIIIEDFFLNFTYIDCNAFIKLFRNLTKKYNMTVIIKEKDTNFLIENCDYLINYDSLKTVSKHEYYLIDYASLDKPDILEFTNLALEKNIKIKYFYNRLDLLKALYKLVM